MAKTKHTKTSTGGSGNPFFRGQEKEFRGGELEICSPVGSIFSPPLRKDNSNVMEDVLKSVQHAGRGDTFGNQRGGRKGRKK